MNIRKFVIILTFLKSLIGNAGDEFEIKYLDNGGVFYSIHASSLTIEPKAAHFVHLEEDWIVVSPHLTKHSFCLVSTEKILVSHTKGHVLVFPEFRTVWLGAIDPSRPMAEETARFELDFGNKRHVMELTTDHYKKFWLSEHAVGGSHFYEGELSQEGFGKIFHPNANKPMLSLVENVEEDDEFQVCLSHISPGTEFRLRSISIIIYPFRKEKS
jgi:hypothetical protein